MHRVLILCTGNSCRSQMAEGLINHDLAGRWQAASAGTRIAPTVHPLAIQVMAELGMDISGQHPKLVDQFRGQAFDRVITVCDNAAADCPVWLGPEARVHMPFDDPAHAQGDADTVLTTFRRVRDEIRRDVVDYLFHTTD